MTPMTDEMSAAVAETDVDMEEPGSNGHPAAVETYGDEDAAARTTAARELQGIVESLLFVSQEPLSIQRLTAVIGDVNKADVVQALQSLGEELAEEGRGIRLAEIAGGFRLVTKQEYASWIKRMDKSKSAAKLSRSALESLAIIAYKQPIVRAEIEEIRGVEASGVVRTLLERKLVRIVGRKEVPGRPIMYGTTKYFLEHFGLADLSQLPPLREFKELGESEQAMLPMDEAENLTANGTADITSIAEADPVFDQQEASPESEPEFAVAEVELTETVVEVTEMVTEMVPESEAEVGTETMTAEAAADWISDQVEVLSEIESECSVAEADSVEAVADVDAMVQGTVSEVETESEATEVMTEAASDVIETVVEVTELLAVEEVEAEIESEAMMGETALEFDETPAAELEFPSSPDDTTERV